VQISRNRGDIWKTNLVEVVLHLLDIFVVQGSTGLPDRIILDRLPRNSSRPGTRGNRDPKELADGEGHGAAKELLCLVILSLPEALTCCFALDVFHDNVCNGEVRLDHLGIKYSRCPDFRPKVPQALVGHDLGTYLVPFYRKAVLDPEGRCFCRRVGEIGAWRPFGADVVDELLRIRYWDAGRMVTDIGVWEFHGGAELRGAAWVWYAR
jgi:hypothetical protein